MSSIRHTCMLIALLVSGALGMAIPTLAHAAKVPAWRTLPLACLPERAISWDNRNSEADQASCHCPPASDCPTTVWPQSKQWPASRILPESLVQRCCPRPVCPTGTTLVGLPIPADGNCDGCRVTVPEKPEQPTINNALQTGLNAHGGQSGFKAHCDGLPNATAKQAAGCHHLDAYQKAQTDYANALQTYNEALVLDTQRIKFEATIMRTCNRNSGMCTSNTNIRAFDGCTCAPGFTRNGDTCVFTFEFQTGGDSDRDRNGRDCMRYDSLVQHANGKKVAIGSVKVGDKLMGPNGLVEVVQTNQLGARQAEYFRINALKLAITGDHPILTTEGWKSIDDVGRDITKIVGRLAVGDELLSVDGSTIKVTSITRIDTTDKVEPAVNIATKDDAPFYVDGVAVKPFRAVEFTY